MVVGEEHQQWQPLVPLGTKYFSFSIVVGEEHQQRRTNKMHQF